jgi:hypothetical protein
VSPIRRHSVEGMHAIDRPPIRAGAYGPLQRMDAPISMYASESPCAGIRILEAAAHPLCILPFEGRQNVIRVCHAAAARGIGIELKRDTQISRRPQKCLLRRK